jgi:hypothetical protein
MNRGELAPPGIGGQFSQKFSELYYIAYKSQELRNFMVGKRLID